MITQLDFFEAINNPTSVCHVCKKNFKKSKYNPQKKIYCSVSCKTKGWRRNNVEKVKELEKKYRIKHKERRKKYQKEYYKNNSFKLNEKAKERLERKKLYDHQYHINNIKKIKERKKRYRDKNKEKIKEQRNRYIDKNKEKIKEKKRLWYIKNKEKIKEQRKEYVILNRERKREYNKKYNYKKYHNDPYFKLRRSLRTRIKRALMHQKSIKCQKTLDLIGCSWQKARDHIQSQFKEGMTWDNHGYKGWHIDHIRPCSSFDLMDHEQQKKCFHYTNLQPLWGHENITKGNKIIDKTSHSTCTVHD